MENSKTNQCPACGGVVSPEAMTCVHCGHPLKKRKKCRSAKWGFIFLALTFLQLPVSVPILDRLFGGDYSANGIRMAAGISILLFVASLFCFTAPSRE